MVFVRLTSIEDARLEPYRHLKMTNQTRWSRRFVVEGEKLVKRLLDSGYETVSVVVDERSLARLPPDLSSNVEILVLPDGAVASLVGFNFHRGMLACAQRRAETELAQLVEGSAANRQTLVVCPDVDDPENLGAILRIAAAFGIDAVILGDRCPDHLSRRVLRVSMGAALRLEVVRSRDLDREFRLLERQGFERIAIVVDSTAEELSNAARGRRLALVLGNEAHGLDPRWLARCSRRVTVDMPGGIDSLNVAVAAGICLHHFAKTAPCLGG